MGIEKEGFDPSEGLENKHEKAPLKNKEKLEAYLGYLVDWKNEISGNLSEIKKKIDEIYGDENMRGFFSPVPEQSWMRKSDKLLSGLGELTKQFDQAQEERNLWSNQVTATIMGAQYDLEHDHDQNKVKNYFWVNTKDDENVEKMITALGLNEFEYPTVVIRKDVLEGELPLYYRHEDEDSTYEKWLKIKDGNYEVESRYSDNDGEERTNEQKFDSYEEALKDYHHVE